MCLAVLLNACLASQPTVLSLYPLITSENPFFHIYTGYRNRLLVWKGKLFHSSNIFLILFSTKFHILFLYLNGRNILILLLPLFALFEETYSFPFNLAVKPLLANYATTCTFPFLLSCISTNLNCKCLKLM